jgi:hypothetical protein
VLVAVVNVASVVWLVWRVWRSDAAAARARRDELAAARTICALIALVFESTGAIPHHCACGRVWVADRPRLGDGAWHMSEGCVQDVEAAA